MIDLKHQIREYYEATTDPVVIADLALEEHEVVVGAAPTRRRIRPMRTMPPETDQATSKWRGPKVAVVALAATVVVALAIVGLIRLIDTDGAAGPTGAGELPPVSAIEIAQKPGATPVELALGFMEARDLRDIDAAMSLLDPEAVIIDSGGGPRAVDEYAGLFEWMEVLDWRWIDVECVQTEAGQPAQVSCTFSMENDWSRARGPSPVEGKIQVSASGGVIDGVVLQLGNVWVEVVFSQFLNWVIQNHPADVEIMWRFDEVGVLNGPSTSPEALDLFRLHTAEYVDEFGGNR